MNELGASGMLIGKEEGKGRGRGGEREIEREVERTPFAFKP